MFVELIVANFYAAFAISTLTNIILIWLIRKHSPAEMFVYIRILLITCAIVLLVSIGSVLEQPVIFQYDKTSAPILLGPLCRLLNGRVLIILWCQLTFLYALNSAQICLQFLYRYFSLNRAYELPMWVYSVVLCLPVTVLQILLYVALNEEPFDEQNERNVLNTFNKMFRINDGLIVAFVQNMETLSKNSFNTVAVILNIIFHSLSYAVVLLCGCKVWMFVRNTYKGPNMAKKREVNRQVTIALCFQALVPLIYVATVFLALSIIYLRVLFTNQQEISAEERAYTFLVLGISTLVPWIPVFNPIITLLTIGKYRRTLLRTIRSEITHAAQPF